MLRMTFPFCRWIHLQQQQNKQWSNSSEYYISLKKLLMEITDEKSLLRHRLHWEIEVSSLVISNQFAIWMCPWNYQWKLERLTMLKNVTNWYGDGKQETYAPYDQNEETILFVFC
jgi:hypothetical protein